MSDHLYDINRDLKEAGAMVKALEHYLKQDSLYGSVSGGFLSFSPMPSLTVGAILLRLRRLEALEADGKLDNKQRDNLRTITSQHKDIYTQNRRLYEEKLIREATSRLKAIHPFFEEAFKDPKSAPRNYRPEAMRRTIVQEILFRMEELGIQLDDELKTLLSTTDNKLRRYATDKNGFVLDPALTDYYPVSPFWWLHQEPHTPEK
jgi:hypothetical protein